MADDDWSKYEEITKPLSQTPGRGSYPAPLPAGSEWDQYQTVREPPVPTHYGAVLPFTTYSDKTSRFEPLTSGLLGGYLHSWKDAYDFSKATQKGASVDARDPNVMGNILNMATLVLPKPVQARSLRTGEQLAADLSKAPAPEIEALLKSGGGKLETARNMPVNFDPQYLKNFGNQAATELLGADVPRSRSPQLYDLLDRIRQTDVNGNPIVAKTPQQLMAWRKTLQELYGTQGETPRAVRMVMDRLNTFIDKPPSQAVMSGPAAEFSPIYRAGNADFSAGMRGKELAAIRYDADLARNPGAAAERGARRALVNDTSLLGYTPAEIASVEAVPKGGMLRNTARAVGSVLDSPVGGLGSGAITAFSGGNPMLGATVGGGVPFIGKAIKGWAGQSSVGALQAAEEATRRRSPLFLEQAKNYDLTPDLVGRNAMVRAIIASQTRPSPRPDPENYLAATGVPVMGGINPQPTPLPVRPPRDRFYDPENFL